MLLKVCEGNCKYLGLGASPQLRHLQPLTDGEHSTTRPLTTSLRWIALHIEIVSHLTIRLARSPVTTNNLNGHLLIRIFHQLLATVGLLPKSRRTIGVTAIFSLGLTIALSSLVNHRSLQSSHSRHNSNASDQFNAKIPYLNEIEMLLA
jgi:hypothetical protein